METINLTCPHCGAEFSCNTTANYCFCSSCGKRIEFVRVSPTDDSTPKEVVKESVNVQDVDNQRKEKRYKQAKFYGSVVVIFAIILCVLGIIESLSLAFFCIVPFIENLFYPFQDDWSTGKRVWVWFSTSAAIIFFWAVAIIVILFLVSILGIVSQ